MSSLESRAWLTLWSLCPPYLVYFAVQLAAPGWLTTMWQRIGFLAAAAGVHVAAFAGGSVWLAARRRGDDGLFADERDLAIDARATRGAYYVLLFGAITVGMVMPFKDSGWKIVNASLLFIVLSEVARNALILRDYGARPQLAR
jgi:uncharacterized membrane protein